MELGDLEFKPEDFSFNNCYGDAKRMIEEACAKQANYILREKLAKAREVEVNQHFVGAWSLSETLDKPYFKCITFDYKVETLDGILGEGLGFRATRGAQGTSEEMYLGIV